MFLSDSIGAVSVSSERREGGPGGPKLLWAWDERKFSDAGSVAGSDRVTRAGGLAW